MLSPEVQKRLLAAQKAEKTYRPNDAICAKLQEKSLVMLVGPTAIGKTFLMSHIAATDSAFAHVPVFTTRAPRPDDDPLLFRTLPHDDQHVGMLLDKIEAREVVQYIVHPTTERIYGTTIDDFPSAFNMHATLSSVVDHLRKLPFKNTFVIGLAAEPAIWKERFIMRYPEENEEKAKRLAEAVSSLKWLLAEPAVRWVDNTSPRPAHAVRSVISIVKYDGQSNPDAAKYAREMYELAVRGL